MLLNEASRTRGQAEPPQSRAAPSNQTTSFMDAPQNPQPSIAPGGAGNPVGTLGRALTKELHQQSSSGAGLGDDQHQERETGPWGHSGTPGGRGRSSGALGASPSLGIYNAIIPRDSQLKLERYTDKISPEYPPSYKKELLLLWVGRGSPGQLPLQYLKALP